MPSNAQSKREIPNPKEVTKDEKSHRKSRETESFCSKGVARGARSREVAEKKADSSPLAYG